MVLPSPQSANSLFVHLGPASKPGAQTRPFLSQSNGDTAFSAAAHLSGLQRGWDLPTLEEEEAETNERPPASNTTFNSTEEPLKTISSLKKNHSVGKQMGGGECRLGHTQDGQRGAEVTQQV